MSDTQKQVIELVYERSRATASARAWSQEEQRRTRETADAAKKAAADTAEAERIANRWAVRDYKDRVRQQVRDAKEAEAAKKKAAEEARKAWDAQNRSILDTVKSVASFAVGMAGLDSARAVLDAIIGRMDALRQQTFDAAKEVMGFREAVLELAALKDSLGDTSPAIAGQLRLRGRTLQTAPAANEMELSARGIGEAAIGRTVDAAAFEKLLISTGRLQAMENSSPGAYGQLAGTLALQARPGATGEELEGQLKKLFDIQKPGGFVNFAQFAKQYAQASPFVQSGIYSQEEAAGLLSALSLTGPETAATRLEQGTRGVSAGLMRARGMKVPDGAEHETSAAYFASLGLKEGDSPRKRLEAIAADLNARQDAARAAGQNFLATDYLLKHGSLTAEANEAYIEMAGLMRSGAWQGKFVPLMDAPAQPGAIEATFNRRVGREPVLQQRQSQIAREAGAINASVGSPAAQLLQVQQAAFERLKADGKVTGTFEEWTNRGVVGRFFGAGNHNEVYMESQRMLAEEAARVGVKFEPPKSVDARSGIVRDEYAGDEALAGLQRRIQQSGGNPTAGVAADVRRAADAMERAAAALEGARPAAAGNPAAANPVPAPLPANPNAGPGRGP